MDGAGDLLVDPDLYVIFTDGLDRRFETDIFLFELEFVLLLESFADVLAGDGAEDAAVFPALDFDDDLDGLELGGHNDGFVCCDLALEFFRFLTLMRRELPYNTPLDSIDIKWIDTAVLNTVTSSEIFDFLSYLTNDRKNREGPTDAGIAAASRARKLSAIKALYKYLTVSTKQISNNPVKDIEFPKIRRSLPKYLTLEESTALLKAVDGPNKNRDFAILMLFLNCGIRRSELVGLNLTDVYEDRIRVVGKGNKERIVYMGSSCRRAIDRYLEERNNLVLTDNKALFGSRDKNRISVSAVHRLVKKHLLESGLDATQFSAHKLRHTAATLMLANGVDLKTLQEVLGHENLNTTQIYTHIENTDKKIAAEANPLSRPALKETHHEKDPVI